MRSHRLALACLVLIASIAVTQVSVASGPAGSAAKKCKKGYKKNKKGKCVKKKFSPKLGLYTSKDGKTRLRVLGSKPKYVRLFSTAPTTLQCPNGQTTQAAVGGLGVQAKIAGKSFKFQQPNTIASFAGKFTSTKALKGTYTLSRQPVPGVTCTSGPKSFSAKRTGN